MAVNLIRSLGLIVQIYFGLGAPFPWKASKQFRRNLLKWPFSVVQINPGIFLATFSSKEFCCGYYFLRTYFLIYRWYSLINPKLNLNRLTLALLR